MKAPLRQRLFDAAASLFYEEGIRGVGVDAIARAAQTTKMALYRHFASKDALITAWLEHLVAQYTAAFDALEQRYPSAPDKQIMGFAQFIADDLARASHRGCPFINSIAELPDASHPARIVIAAHKARQLVRMERLCAQAGLPHPAAAALHLSCVLEGAQIMAQNGAEPHIGPKLLAMVRAILKG
ncbi:TetR family transcriptional regulator [Duganella sp. CY15W]|uniref:TetR/AcrR family transcriptional regulator n=1 Tax=Duganella sp. CY15W TaxID=2692172 RepID=UPI00136C2765|nr:TetR/AcrR family transcriptional regulator [Duganella sp. CY15W]MYM29983.1 TetR family transcriptional regulator [Duganella sp. CY15W]